MRKIIQLFGIGIGIGIFMITSFSWADDVGDLIQFSAGETAVAADVNTNFDDVKTAVNTKQDRVDGTCPAGQHMTGVNADGTVICTAISVGAVGTSEIADNSITAADIATDGVGADEIAAGAVGTSEIHDGTITNADISASAAISASKILDGAGSGLDADLLDGLDSASWQRRVSSSCSSGSAIASISSTGTVTCEPISPTTTKYVSINCYGTRLGIGATFTSGFSDDGAIKLPNIGGSFDLTFSIPPDFVAGTTVYLEVLWHPLQSGTGNINWRANWASRLADGGGVTSFTFSDPADHYCSSATTTYKTVFTISSSLAAGDAIALGIFRPDDLNDSYAGDIVIGGIRARYTGTK